MTDPSDPGVRALAVAPEATLVRAAGAGDVPELARLINAAFVVERFFKRGDRTTVEEIRGLARRGEFLMLDGPEGTAASTGRGTEMTATSACCRSIRRTRGAGSDGG